MVHSLGLALLADQAEGSENFMQASQSNAI
jgi:hypothetical protein